MSAAWAIVDEDGKEYVGLIGEPITAPTPGFYTIKWPGRKSSDLPMVLVLPSDDEAPRRLKWLPIEALSAGGPPLLRKLLRLGLVR